MPIHVAILRPPYSRLILAGRKTIESRLTKSDLVPFEAIKTGERIFIKQTSGPFIATAVAGQVHFFDRLTRDKIAALKARFNEQVCGDDEFWQWKRDSKFATFIELTHVQPVDRGPRMTPSSGLAWFVLPDELAPSVPVMFEVTLTAGAIKNHYLRVARKVFEFDAKHYGGKTIAQAGVPITLILPDGSRIATDIVSNQMLRWRGWQAWYQASHMVPGDLVRFVEQKPGEYVVTFVNQS